MTEVRLVELTKSFGGYQALKTLTLSLQSGSVLGLLGPSGCGKTTTLRCLAGLIAPTSGEIWFDDRMVNGRGINVPPDKRALGMVFQSYALWPHMSVFNNVAFPLRNRRISRKGNREDIRNRVMTTLEMFGLAEQAEKYPNELSGGQQQRVALARSIVASPKVLLFDEPLSNLDAKLRLRVRDEIQRVLAELRITSVYVTHDQSEAMALCDQVAVMNSGVVEQVGSPEDLYRSPANPFVADFIGGGNLIPAIGTATGRDGDLYGYTAAIGPTTIKVSQRSEIPSAQLESLTLVIREEEGVLNASRTNTGNSLPIQITGRAYLGSQVRYQVAADGFSFAVRSSDGQWQVGDRGYFNFTKDAVLLVPGRLSNGSSGHEEPESLSSNREDGSV